MYWHCGCSSLNSSPRVSTSHFASLGRCRLKYSCIIVFGLAMYTSTRPSYMPNFSIIGNWKPIATQPKLDFSGVLKRALAKSSDIATYGSLESNPGVLDAAEPEYTVTERPPTRH